MLVDTKWIFLGGGDHVCSTLRLRLRLGIVSRAGYTQIYMFWGMFDKYIFSKGCGAK